MSDLLQGLFRMTAGIGIFLLGMTFLEESLRALAGRKFKLYLRNQASGKFSGVLGGMVVTAVLQSSSIVNLMVLAMVGSNVLKLENALAVILGSNIGTTIDSWIVALAGFHFSVETFAYPLLGIATILRLLFTRGSDRFFWSEFFLGIGAVFTGLEFMKSGFLDLAAQIDFAQLQKYPLVIFLVVGFIITAIIQSSYATMAIMLSAVHAQAMEVVPATAVILGAEVGTTIKLLIASAGGASVKRQVAFGNFIYNFLVIAIAFLFIRPINMMVLRFTNADPMILLVSFQTFINLAGALVFLPFLKIAGKWLEKRFVQSQTLTAYVQNLPADTGDLGIEAFEKEVRRFLEMTICFIRHSFHIRKSSTDKELHEFSRQPASIQYDLLKSLHGEIHSWYIQQRKTMADEPVIEHAEQLISSLRNAMFAAKSIHDSAADIQQLKNSSKDEKYSLYDRARLEATNFCQKAEILLHASAADLFEDVVGFYEQIKKDYGLQVSQLYDDGIQLKLNESELSTLINFNRERFSGYKSLIWSLKDLILDKKQSSYFSDLPGFIR